REAEIAARGYALQVTPQPGVSPLFLLRGGERRRIEWRGDDRFALRGVEGEEPVAALLETIDENPAVVSPGVLARPAIQDATLGTSVLILGPGETAYLPQAAPAYELLGIAPPALALRPQAVVLDGRQMEHLDDLGLGLADLLGDPTAARRRLGERAGGGFVDPVRARVAEILGELGAPATALDPNLEKPFEKTRESVDRALEAFAGKVAAAAARRDELHSQRLDQLLETLQPGGAFQERSLSAGFFPGKYGESFGAALLDQLGLDPRYLSVVDPTRPTAPAAGE
ncbi:MAG: bacillithiol biosynthesis BshC, partial [Acidobacteria bacterium]|nr:bacillithiol biosynthesis BshC [Acidobacteriota bacterium]